MRLTIIATASIVLAAPTAAAPSKTNEPPATFTALIQCRSITDPAQRLSCFDNAASALEEAAAKRDVVVVDREQVRRSKRTLFGLEIPNLNLFGRDEDEEDQVKFVEGVVAGARMDQDNRWIIQLEDGATWQQIDGKAVARRPRPGFKTKISRAALGSFMMQIEGQPGIRVRRVR